MRIWQVVLLLGLSLTAGTGFGFAKWGLLASRLNEEIGSLQREVNQLKRERAARDAGADAGQQQWEGFGVVRATYPRLLIITHDDIPDMLQARTTSFRLASSAVHDHIAVGDAIRFFLHGSTPQNAAIVALEKW
mgnify:CR=1 FL=1